MMWDLYGWRDVNRVGNLGGEAPAEWGKFFVPIFQNSDLEQISHEGTSFKRGLL